MHIAIIDRFLLLLFFLFSTAIAQQPQYPNSYAKDIFTDAPWFIKNADEPVPVIFVIKDADVIDLEELEALLVEVDISEGNFARTDTLFHRIYDPVLYDFDLPYWDTLIYVEIPDDFDSGDIAFLRTTIDFEDGLPWDEGFSQVLRVKIGHSALPSLYNWYAGDCHFHTIMTTNPYESGGDFPMIKTCAKAMGLSFITTTDHASDSSYFAGVLIDDLNLSDWNNLPDSFTIYGDDELVFIRGEEADIENELGDTRNHFLICGNDSFFSAPIPETFPERSFEEVYQFLSDSPEAVSYAAHPYSPDYLWSDEIVDSGLRMGVLNGLQIWNERSVWKVNVDMDEYCNPFPFSFGDMLGRDGKWDSALLDGLAKWQMFIWSGLAATDGPRKVFISGGSDAHGDFNYFTYNRFIGGLPTPDIWSTDNAFAKVRSLAYCPDGLSPDAVLDAMRMGRLVVTDGPALAMSCHRSFGDTEIHLGDADTVEGDESLYLEYVNSEDFGGEIVSLELTVIYGDTLSVTKYTIDIGSGSLYGREIVPLPVPLESGWFALYAEARTFDEGEQYIQPDSSFRAITNPIWFYVPEPLAVLQNDEQDIEFELNPNPFNVSLNLPSDLEIEIFDNLGNRIFDGLGQGRWTPRSNTPSGIYLVKAGKGKKKVHRKVLYIK